MTDDLYRQAILEKAREAVGAGSLESPDARVVVENPVCGDRIVMEIRIADGTIAALAYKVRGCVLCQAAASLIGSCAVGADRDTVDAVGDAVAAIMEGTGEPPSGLWQDLAIFTSVAAHKSRHQCVLLPFEALRRAFDAAARTE